MDNRRALFFYSLLEESSSSSDEESSDNDNEDDMFLLHASAVLIDRRPVPKIGSFYDVVMQYDDQEFRRNFRLKRATRPTNNMYLSHENDASLFPAYLSSVVRCSMSQCIYACFLELECHYVYLNEEIDGCNECFMYCGKRQL